MLSIIICINNLQFVNEVGKSLVQRHAYIMLTLQCKQMRIATERLSSFSQHLPFNGITCIYVLIIIFGHILH